MSNPGSTGTEHNVPADAEGSAPEQELPVIFAEGLGDRRRAARYPVELDCTVFTGSHVHEGVLRNVSAGGAMLRNVAGLAPDDLVLIRLTRRPDLAFRGRVRDVSLLGTHLAIEGETDQVIWHGAVLEAAD